MKRKLTLFLSAVMAASSLPMTAYAANFKDIDDQPWAASAINSAADRGLVSGIGDNKYGGRNNVTYPQAMQMIYNALMKSGNSGIDAVTAYNYMQMLDTYQVPKWSQVAVAYGLENNLITMADVATDFAGGTKAATREDVAAIFGKALAFKYDVDGKAQSAQEFVDYWSISSELTPLVDLLKRLEIVSGDDTNRFNPKANINRAEMAVMLNKTFDVLAEGIGSTGEIVDFQNNDGDFFYIEVKWDDNGRTQGFHAQPDGVKAFDANGNAMALSRLSKGDEVRLVHNGDMLFEVHVTDGVTAQEKYDITGYITNYKEHTITVENENTGETDKYNIASDCYIYVEGVLTKRAELEQILKDNYKLHAYAGLVVEVNREKTKDETGKNQWEYVTDVLELHITFHEDLVINGKVDDLNENRVRFKPTGSSNNRDISFATDCKFYINGSKADLDELIELADDTTTYVNVTVNEKGDATEVYLSEDAFEESTSGDGIEDRILTLEDLTEKKIQVEVGSKDITYRFDSGNPIENIRFYVWDSNDADGDWDDYDDDDAIAWFNEQEKEAKEKNEELKLYCQIDMNSGGKVTSVEMSTTKKAWSSDDDQNERKGTIESLKDGVLKFKGASTKYTMLSKYNDKNPKDDDDVITGSVGNLGTVGNPLEILSAYTPSLKVFEKMANDSELELYAEIIADSDNKVQAVEAKLTKAEGKLVELDLDEDFIKIETSDYEYKLNITGSPDLTDEDEDYFELEDLEGTKYAGEKVQLEFNSNGLVDTITVVNGPKSGVSSVKVKGVAVSADENGLKVKGDSKTYRWLSKESSIYITNFSGPRESLNEIKRMISDSDLKVYAEARLDDKERVESIEVHVQEAVGKLVKRDKNSDYLRLETSSGEAYSFAMKSGLELNLTDYDEDDLDAGKAYSKTVKVTFGSDGRAVKIDNK